MKRNRLNSSMARGSTVAIGVEPGDQPAAAVVAQHDVVPLQGQALRLTASAAGGQGSAALFGEGERGFTVHERQDIWVEPYRGEPLPKFGNGSEQGGLKPLPHRLQRIERGLAGALLLPHKGLGQLAQVLEMVWCVQPLAGCLQQRSGTGHTLARTELFDGAVDRVGVVGVGPEEHGLAQRHGLQGVVAADGHQRAANEADLCLGIPVGQFAHGVAQPDAGGRVGRIAAAASDHGQTQRLDRPGHAVKAFGMAGHQDQDGIGVSGLEGRPRVEQGRFFTLVGAARHHQASGQWGHGARRVQGSGQGLVELEVAGDVEAGCRNAERLQAGCRFLVGAGGQSELGPYALHEPLPASVAGRRGFGQPRIDERHRYGPRTALMHPLGPDLALDQDHQAGLQPVQKPGRGARRVHGKEEVLNGISEQRLELARTGRRLGGDGDAVVGP
jgi:hypothetical protein